MGEPITGAWARKYQLEVSYVDARRWGTGINPVHAIRGDTSRPQNPRLDEGGLDQTPAHLAYPGDFVESPPDWGYECDDIAGLDVFTSAATEGIPVVNDPDWPNREETDSSRAYIRRETSHPWGMSALAKTLLRSMRAGQHDEDYRVSNEVPTETVSEGWLNKPDAMGIGEIPDDNVLTSDPAQYERQTSMQQRHMTLNNERAVNRGADDERTSIESRIAPMKVKVYSGDERHYDMFPYQMDDMPRPFAYRTAGVGPVRYMQDNAQYVRTPLQRTPPPDPSMGTPDTELSETDQYGYAGEDQGFY